MCLKILCCTMSIDESIAEWYNKRLIRLIKIKQYKTLAWVPKWSEDTDEVGVFV